MGGLIEFIAGILVPAVLIVAVAGGAAFAIIFLVEWTDK
jgi:hypothetical protein